MPRVRREGQAVVLVKWAPQCKSQVLDTLAGRGAEVLSDYSRGQFPDRHPETERQEQDQKQGRASIQPRVEDTLPERPN